MKPDGYRNIHIIHQRTPYMARPDCKDTSSSIGILDIGRVMWIKESLVNADPDRHLLCYAEGIGLVSLKARFLQSSHEEVMLNTATTMEV